jgi:hypothetical protein
VADACGDQFLRSGTGLPGDHDEGPELVVADEGEQLGVLTGRDDNPAAAPFGFSWCRTASSGTSPARWPHRQSRWTSRQRLRTVPADQSG